MKLDTRPVIDQLTEDMHASEVEDRLAALDIAIDDAAHYLKGHNDPRAKSLVADMCSAFDVFWSTLNSYMGRPA